MKRLKKRKVAEVVQIDEKTSVDLDKIEKAVKKDFAEIPYGYDLSQYMRSAKAVGADTEAFDGIYTVYQMKDLDDAIKTADILDFEGLLKALDDGSVSISLKDKYIVIDNETKIRSTSDDLDAAFEKIGEEAAKLLVSKIKADPKSFKDIYDKYELEGMD